MALSIANIDEIQQNQSNVRNTDFGSLQNMDVLWMSNFNEIFCFVFSKCSFAKDVGLYNQIENWKLNVPNFRVILLDHTTYRFVLLHNKYHNFTNPFSFK